MMMTVVNVHKGKEMRFLLLGGGTTRSTETERSLECVVDPPLETSEGTNHEDTCANTLGGKVEVAKLGSDCTHALALVLSLTQEGDQSVSGVGDDSADDTGKVTRHKSDLELSSLAVAFTGLGVDVCVEHGDDLLKEVELGHGVRDLARPQGHEGTKGEAGLSREAGHLSGSSNKTSGESTGRGGLDLDLDHFHGAEGNIGEELGGSGGREPEKTTVLIGSLLADHVGVHILEDLVEAKLAKALHGVTNQGRGPTLDEGTDTFLSNDGADTTHETLVLAGVDLHVALGHIQRSDGSVCKTAAKNTTNHALHVVLVGVGNGVSIACIPLALSWSGSDGLARLNHILVHHGCGCGQANDGEEQPQRSRWFLCG
eukprot:m.88559 g.88559  ORF g.88559 m.88559 type:complete len:371 (+) comp14544_c0_seq1:1858-2970(+)